MVTDELDLVQPGSVVRSSEISFTFLSIPSHDIVSLYNLERKVGLVELIKVSSINH